MSRDRHLSNLDEETLVRLIPLVVLLYRAKCQPLEFGELVDMLLATDAMQSFFLHELEVMLTQEGLHRHQN